ncbi:Mfa1 family fimbria major subunit [Bacteroides sp. 51]|uniref:Mfa1 family fimbria major subunit n=1 Tax=Bacteroides sp. 51 TaxID=2302938 RepID=UPI0013D14969|nr:Mfa1 family fimbria major subunit [Bacteroides sp. 51]NDV80635.1 hypothetical protein [Bacteroides sp. 51]
MKMNFKYVSMFACAALMAGLTSCSDKNDNEGTDPDVTAEETTMTISLKTLGAQAGTRAVSEYPATNEESIIYNAKVYVFNSNKVLQQIVDMEVDPAKISAGNTTTEAKKVFKTNVGNKYFLAVANLNPSSTTNVPLGTSLDNLVQIIENVNQAKFTTFLDPGDATATGLTIDKMGNTKKTGFLMTSGVNLDEGTPNWYKTIDYVEREVVTPDDPRFPANNNVSIYIGRAMAKVSVNMQNVKTPENTVAVYQKKTNGKLVGHISDMQYVLTNNPVKMYYFPFFGTLQRFQTPEWMFYDGTAAPQLYWPALHDQALSDPAKPNGAAATKYGTVGGPNEGFDYKPVLLGSKGTQENLLKSTFYAVENTNNYPTYGNTTIAQIRARFTPDNDAKADAGTWAADGTYYRVWWQIDAVTGDGEWISIPNETDGSGNITVNNEHKNFWTSPDAILNYFTVDDGTGTGTMRPRTEQELIDDLSYQIIEFKGGICYYMVPLRNTYLQDDPSQQKGNENIVYSVVRNHYYDITVTGITDSGYPAPGGGPGPGEETEPEDPLDPEESQYIQVQIEVKPWVWVKQSEEIGIRD